MRKFFESKGSNLQHVGAGRGREGGDAFDPSVRGVTVGLLGRDGAPVMISVDEARRREAFRLHLGADETGTPVRPSDMTLEELDLFIVGMTAQRDRIEKARAEGIAAAKQTYAAEKSRAVELAAELLAHVERVAAELGGMTEVMLDAQRVVADARALAETAPHARFDREGLTMLYPPVPVSLGIALDACQAAREAKLRAQRAEDERLRAALARAGVQLEG